MCFGFGEWGLLFGKRSIRGAPIPPADLSFATNYLHSPQKKMLANGGHLASGGVSCQIRNLAND